MTALLVEDRPTVRPKVHKRSPRAARLGDSAGSEVRLAGFQRLMESLSVCRGPCETLEAICRGMNETYGSRVWIMLSTRDLRAGEFRVLKVLRDGHDADGRDPWRDHDCPVQRGGVIGRIIKNRSPQIANDVDWTSDPIFREALAGYGSLLAVPCVGESLPMTWVLLLKRTPDQFTTDELEQAVLRTTIIGSLLESKALGQELEKAHRLIDHDAREVGELQRSLLPHPLPRIPGLEIAASYRPCGRAGGDLYDVFPLDDTDDSGRWCVFIADASGHGLAAAVVIAMVQSILRAHASANSAAGELLAHVNRQLSRRAIGGFVTAFLAVYEPSTRRLSYACAGHPPPLVRTDTAGRLLRLDRVGSCPLGINEEEQFDELAIRLQHGDTVLLYTDGVTEARNLSNHMFTEQRLQRALRPGVPSPTEALARVDAALAGFREGRSPDDDQTLVAMTVLGREGDEG